jgi:hypothetical protein
MGLLDHIRRGGDEPAALLRDYPSVLLATAPDPNDVAALLRSWSPSADPSGHGQEVADGIRWYGPLALDDQLVDEASLPAGFAVAHVARCHRSRMLRTPASRRLLKWAQRFTDSRLGLDHRVTEQADADLETDYPGGLPTGVEAHAWNLVRGIARTLGGIALLPDNPGYSPVQDENPGAIVYSATALTPEEARALLTDLVPGIDEAEDEELISDAGFWLLRADESDFSVAADLIEDDDVPPAVRHLGDRLTAYDATAPDDKLEGAVAARLARATHGVVLDEFGFPRTQLDE